MPFIFSLAIGKSRLAEIGLVTVPPIAPDVDPLVVRHATVKRLGVFTLEMQRNNFIETAPIHNPKANEIVRSIGSNDIAATRPADEREVFVGFIWIAFHRCIFSSNRPLAIAA